MTPATPPRPSCRRCHGRGAIEWLGERVSCACTDETWTERAGPPFELRLPIETPWHEAQRQLFGAIGAYFEDGMNDWQDALAINLAVAGMLSEAARRALAS